MENVDTRTRFPYYHDTDLGLFVCLACGRTPGDGHRDDCRWKQKGAEIDAVRAVLAEMDAEMNTPYAVSNSESYKTTEHWLEKLQAALDGGEARNGGDTT